MDSFFGIGIPELVLILLIAGIVMGPERIGHTARWLGRVTAQLQAISRGFMRQINSELDAADGDGTLKETWQDVQDLRQQLAELRGELTSVAQGTMQDTRKLLDESKADIERSIAPPNLPNKSTELTSAADGVQNGQSTLPPLPKRVAVEDDPDL